MNNKMAAAGGALLFIGIMAAALIAYNLISGSVAPGDISAVRTETKAPDFTVVGYDDNEHKLSDFLGMPVVLNFWASWCPPCRREMPDFDRVYKDLGDSVKFMMVCLTDGMRESKETGAAYIAGERFSFPVYFDIKGEASAAYAIRSIPTTVFIDKDGYIISSALGEIDEQRLRQAIDLIIN